MAHSFQFSEEPYEAENVLDSSVLIDNEGIWSKDPDEEQIVLSYMEDGDITSLQTSADGYLTAEEDGNATQYFSVLDSTNSKIILSELNEIKSSEQQENETDVTASQIENEEDSDSLSNIRVGGQPIIFRVEDSDDLYALELFYDQEGNAQQFQYKLRLNENGEYESVPDSVEFLTQDNELQVESIGLSEDQIENCESPNVKQEHEFLDSQSNVPQREETEEEFALYQEETNNDNVKDCKAGILEITKQELVDSAPSHEPNTPFEQIFLEHKSLVSENGRKEELPEKRNEIVPETQCNRGVLQQDLQEVEKSPIRVQSDVETAQIMEPQLHEVTLHTEIASQRNELVSDGDKFQLIEETHIATDMDSEQDEPYVVEELIEFVSKPVNQVLRIQQQQSQQQSTNFPSNNTKVKQISKPHHNNAKMVKNYPYLIITNTEKENFRTPFNTPGKLVKTNPRSVLKTSVMPQEQKEVKPEIPVKIEKRVIRNREVVQARQFHNLLAKTTILQAPIRQERLPRKQTIKPVERADEEIIVKEMLVSSRGYEEPLYPIGFRKRNAIVSDIVQLSDSDYEYNPKSVKQKRRKKRRTKITEIVISDSEEEEDEEEVIHIDLSRDTDEENEENTRKEMAKNSLKRKRGRPPKPQKTKSEQIKVEWTCINCPKSFPSEGSLKSHMQFHKFQPSRSKHECLKCGEEFKNTILLSRHTEAHKTLPKSLQCALCKKIFWNVQQASEHKRKHIKTQLFNESSLVKLCPKVSKDTLGNSSSRPAHKCPYCRETFTSIPLLNTHSLSHKKCTCSTCGSWFHSKLVLEDHLRTKCVKSPKRRTVVGLRDDKQCDRCSLRFVTFKELHKHRALVHKIKGNHGGVPVIKKVRTSFARLVDK